MKNRMVVARAPYRLSLFGGGTDFPGWFRGRGAAVIAVALDYWCWATVRWMPPFWEGSHKVSWRITEEPKSIAGIRNPIVRETMRYLEYADDLWVDIRHAGYFPHRSGMGASSAFTVALYLALARLKNPYEEVDDSRRAVANAAIHIEREMMGDAGGWQDQIMASYGALRHIRFWPDYNWVPGEWAAEGIPLSAEHRMEVEGRLMLFHTGVAREGDVAQESQDAIGRNGELLERLASIERYAYRLLIDGELESFGRLMDDAWKVKREMAPGMSRPKIDLMYEEGLRAGAWGGKLCGAGGGGFLLFCVPKARRRAVREAMKGAREVRVQFTHRGGDVVLDV